MAMTQEQIEWLKANREALASEGYNPDETEISPEGDLVKVPRYGYLETLARQGAKSILPTGASLAAGAAAAPFGAPLGPLGIAGAGLLGALTAGGVTGYAQEKALDALASEFQAKAAQSAEQNPKTAWLGEQATALATMKPNFRVLANASVLGKSALQSPAMKEAALNAAINAGGAAAGQGVNMLQGGEFEPGRFLADTALGSVLTDPNRLGQKLGLKASSQQTPLAKVKDLAYEQSEMQRARSGAPADADWAKLPPIEVEVASKAEEKLAAKVRAVSDKGYTKWWKSETKPTDKMFTEMMNESKLTILPEKLAELRQMPEAIAAMKSPEAFKDFVWSSSEEALQEAYAYKKKQGELLADANEATLAEKYRSLKDSTKLAADMQRGRLASQEGSPRELAVQMGAGRERLEALKATEPYVPKGQDLPPGEVPPFIPEPVKPQAKKREVISKDLLKPSAEDVAKVAENESAMAKLQAEQDAVELAQLKDLEAADSLTQEAKARLTELEKPFNERVKLNKDLGLPEALTKASNQETPELAQARQNAKEAEALRDELYNRLSRSASDAGKPLTQAELARMTQVAAKRGLTVTFEDLGNNRGQYVLATKEGQPLLKVNPLTATIDTIAHEVGHDVFNRSASKGMKDSLMETALESDAYKRELALRLEQGATQEQAHSIAAEEGLIHAFANAGNKTDASDVRAWFKAFKASIKHLAGAKLAPEDAIAWMHYATHNDTPWSGLKNRGAGGARNQGEEDKPSLRQIHELDQIEGAVESKVEQSQKRFEESELKVGDILFTPQGTAITIYAPGIHKNKAGESFVYGKGSRNGEDFTSHIKLDLLSFDNPLFTRNQGPSLGPLDSEQRKVSRINPALGDATAATSKTIPRVVGHLTVKLSEIAKLNESQKLELNNHVANEMDNGTLVAPPAELAAAYEQMRNVFIPEVPRMFNAEGFGIRSASGLRPHGENPTYVPLHHMSPDVRDVITNKQGSPEYAGLRAEFINWTAEYLTNKKRMPADEARLEARARFDKEVNESNRPQDASEAMGFAGVRKPEGAPLPPSWRSNDLMGNLTNYIKRVATDFAVQKHIESSPEVMAALGAKKYGQDIEIPQDILDATASVINNKHVQNVLKDLRGRAADDSVMADIGRVISPLALGHISRGADVMSTTGKGLVYLRPSEYYEGTKMFVDKLFNWAELKARSHESGLNRLDTGANMRHVMGVGDANVSFLTKAAALINKLGLNQLESFARVIAQGWGETLVAINRAKAMSGDQKSVEFLDTLSKDWRSRDDLDLSGQVGRLLQGSYDTQQLPQWMIDGPLAPYLVWSKWSMGQLQAFNDFAVAPLLKGDAKPLVGQILIGLLGGAAVNQVQEWVNNRDTRDLNWSELQAWADQNKGELGGTGQKLLASKLLAYTQKMGTFGFAGDMAKMMTEAMAGQVPQGVLHNPTIDFIYNTSKHGAAAMSAISSGEDVGLIIEKLAIDLSVNNSQIARATRNWVDTDENLAYNDRRRQNLFNFLRGEGAGASTFAVSYKDLDEKEFDKTKEPADMVAQAGKLLEKAATDATSQEDFVARLRKLGASQNSVMPNPKRQPDKAFKYLKWVHDAEGADESSSTQRRWLEEDARAKYRRALVSPGSAGAR